MKKNPFNFELRVLLKDMNLHEIDEITFVIRKQTPWKNIYSVL